MKEKSSQPNQLPYLFGTEDCTEIVGQNLKYKVLVLKPSVLRKEYQSADYQLFFSTDGFGCSPDKSGVKIYGEFLKDGEGACFTRQDIIGVLKPDFLPAWAKVRLRELQVECGIIPKTNYN